MPSVLEELNKNKEPTVLEQLGDSTPKKTRPYYREFGAAVARGAVRTWGAGKQLGASLISGPSAVKKPETGVRGFLGEQARLKRQDATLLWRLSKSPKLAAQNKDIASKALNLIGETIPYIAGTTLAYMSAGPMGGFAVGSAVEGNSAYRTAIDQKVPKNKAKAIGVGVGLVSGAIESFGGKYAEQLLTKATAKLKSRILQGGAAFGIGTVIEALEEGGQEIAQLTGESTYRNINWNEAVNRTLGSMAGGAFLGGTMNIGRAAGRGLFMRGEKSELSPTEQARMDKLAEDYQKIVEEGGRNAKQRLLERLEQEKQLDKPPAKSEVKKELSGEVRKRFTEKLPGVENFTSGQQWQISALNQLGYNVEPIGKKDISTNAPYDVTQALGYVGDLIDQGKTSDAILALRDMMPPTAQEVAGKEEGGGQDWASVVRQGLEKSKKARRKVTVEQHKERSRRAGAYEGTIKWLMEKQGLPAKEAIDRATAMLKGPLTEYQLYQGLDEFLPRETIDKGYEDIATTKNLRPYERKVAKDAFEKLEKGEVLAPHQARIIKKWRPEFAAIAEQRVPLTAKIFSKVEQALGLLKFGAAFDVQMRRQARWLRGRHPVMFGKTVGKNLGAYVSQKYADKLAGEVVNDPLHQEAKDHGVQFLERHGQSTEERPEQYISIWGERIPIVGKAYSASMRGFVDSFNWLQQQLWNHNINKWEKKGVKITEEMLYDLADFNNTFLGMSKAKTNFGRATRRVLAPVMWSPTLTWSRVRSPGMIFTNPTMRKETAATLSTYIGTGLLYMAAASFVARSLKKKDPVEWNPSSPDFGKIRIRNTRIDVFGDGGPYIRALAQFITGQKKNQAGRIRRRPRMESIKQFVRNKRAPIFDLIGKIWSGRTYYGGPAWEMPDWSEIEKEGGAKGTLAKAGKEITKTPTGKIIGLVSREVYQKFAPFFVQSTIEAGWHDGWYMAMAAGGDEFFSGQALSYKPSTSAELQMKQDTTAVAEHDKLWDDLVPEQQTALRKKYPEIDRLEERAATERLPVEDIDLREQNRAAEKVTRNLPDNIRDRLDDMNVRITGLTRRVGAFHLNDRRFDLYVKYTPAEISKELNRIFNLSSWPKLSDNKKRELVENGIKFGKQKARTLVLAKDMTRGQIKKALRGICSKKDQEDMPNAPSRWRPHADKKGQAAAFKQALKQ